MTRTEAKRKADALFARLVRTRGSCERCGSRRDLQCAHGFSRRYAATRWDERNAFCLCKGCHYFFTLRPLEWLDWMRAKLGGAEFELLRARALSVTKVDANLARIALEQERHRC